MTALRSYYYNYQMRNYLLQFMAVFSDMQVSVGQNEDLSPRLIKVPVYGASKDRVVAAIKSENTQNKPIRLPAMSAWLYGIDQAPDMRKGIGGTRRQSYMPTGGLFPDDISVVEQRQPVPYKAQYELVLWSSNQDHNFQLLEQIMMLFNPQIQIQTSDDGFDWTKITQIELTDIQQDENMDAGGDRRISKTTLRFTMPIWIAAPVDVHQRYIKDIYLRVGAVSSGSVTNEQFVSDLDAQGIPYELKFSVDDVDIT